MSENWDFYPCRVEDQPASIMVNLALASEAPISNLPECAWLHVQMNNPRDDGLSSSEEFDRLCEIGDAIEAAVADSTSAVRYVGRCTSAGRRDFYAYAESGLVAESLLSGVMSGFPEYRFETGFREDAQWRLYQGFLYPTGHSLQLIYNRRVLEALEKAGDQLNVPRPIRHFARFGDVTGSKAFCEAVGEEGFEILAQDPDNDSPPLVVAFERIDSVNFIEINNLTVHLLDLANSHEGDYDGWETEVQQAEDQ